MLQGSDTITQAKSPAHAPYRLKIAASEQKLQKNETFFADIWEEYKKLKPFLSQPVWMEIAADRTIRD